MKGRNLQGMWLSCQWFCKLMALTLVVTSLSGCLVYFLYATMALAFFLTHMRWAADFMHEDACILACYDQQSYMVWWCIVGCYSKLGACISWSCKPQSFKSLMTMLLRSSFVDNQSKQFHYLHGKCKVTRFVLLLYCFTRAMWKCFYCAPATG